MSIFLSGSLEEIFSHLLGDEDLDIMTKIEKYIGWSDEYESKDDTGIYPKLLMAFSCLLGCSILDIDRAMTSVFDLSVIRRGTLERIQSLATSPKKNRTILELGNLSYDRTRFTQEELHRMKDLLFGSLPTNTYSFKRQKYTYEETLIIALDYNAHGTKFSRMADTYGGDFTRYSHMQNWFSAFMYHKYFHRLCGRSLEYWFRNDNPRIFREAIYNQVKFGSQHANEGVVPDELQNFTLGQSRVLGFMDCMMHAMCQPASGPRTAQDERVENRWLIQRAFYTAYGKMWGMKTQGVFFPNGMLGNLFFDSVAQNDKGLVNISGIEEELERTLERYKLYDGTVYPCVYADDIYIISTVITKKTEDNLFHTRMNGCRVDIEHEFGLVSSMIKRLLTKHCWKLCSQRNRVRHHLFTCFFIVNMFTCLRGNKTSTKFNLPPPSLEEYLNVGNSVRFDGECSERMDEYMSEFLTKFNR
jgi:hypothetical protein